MVHGRLVSFGTRVAVAVACSCNCLWQQLGAAAAAAIDGAFRELRNAERCEREKVGSGGIGACGGKWRDLFLSRNYLSFLNEKRSVFISFRRSIFDRKWSCACCGKRKKSVHSNNNGGGNKPLVDYWLCVGRATAGCRATPY